MLSQLTKSEAIRRFYNSSKLVLFPLIIVLFSLIKVDKGINLQDATYSLGNFSFFPESQGTWFLLTFVSNAVGYVFTLLPFGHTMLGMKLYTSLVIALMGLLAYRFFMTKMPAWLAFLSVMMSVGMCWAPSTILYHYLTYFFLLLGGILLFRGLAGDRPLCLFLAGVALGTNLLVRFPGNGLEVLLIIPLIHYGILMKKKSGNIVKEIGICVGGYISALAIIMTAMSFMYGISAIPELFSGAFGIAGSASDYTLGGMLASIMSAYLHGMRWAVYIIICTLMGIPFFLLFGDKYVKARKLIYCVCIVFLFFVLSRWGMFNFKYYQKESALSPGVIFLMISMAVDIWILLTKQMNYDWKLLGGISLVMLLITPLGSNNHIWPNLNNLFFSAPVTVWIVYRFVRWGRRYLDSTAKVPLFAAKAMLLGCVLLFFIQSIGVGAKYIFAEGENGDAVRFEVSDNTVLKGMKTTEKNAESLTGLSEYLASRSKDYDERKLVLYGNIPGLSFILDKPSALNTTWSDLDSNPVEAMKDALNKASEDCTGDESANRPLVIISDSFEDNFVNVQKHELLDNYLSQNRYTEVFNNDTFVVYE